MKDSIKNNPIALILLIFMVLMVAGWVIPFFTGDRIDYNEREEWSGPWHMMGMGGMWMFPFFPIIVLGLILYFAFGRERWHRYDSESGESALELLKKRYAKGEITKEAFEEIRKDLLS